MDSKEIYQYRIQKVIDFITTHISEDLSLDRLADEAGFSRFHFHRIFSAMIGETPADYVLRNRLELAANFLVKTNRTVTQIAMEFGFSSPAVFTRAFRQYFHCTPRDYKQQSPQISRDMGETGIPSATPSPEFHLEPIQVKDLEDTHVIYIASTGGYILEKICLAWEKLYRWASLHNLLTPASRAIGISFDDPMITQSSKCRYYACFSVPAGAKGNSQVGTLVIPGGKYAVFHATCQAADIQYIYQLVYREWLPASGYQPSNSFPYEIYIDTPSQLPPSLYQMEIFFPVEEIGW